VRHLEEAAKLKNVGNTVVLARLFNEASGQKTPSKNVSLFNSHPLAVVKNKIAVSL
jgi:hypothetical protein